MTARAATGMVVALLLASCAGGVRAPTTADDPDAAAWELPASALGTQRLYRVGYEGPDGGGHFRLTLRLGSADRYQVRAVDPIGRALWSLDVDGGRGLWIDHRAAAACRLEGRLDIATGQLTPFPLAAIPALLLGRLPAIPQGTPVDEEGSPGEEVDEPAPAEGVPAASGSGSRRLVFLDRQGRRWSAVVDGGTPLSWAMSEPGESVPGVWWRRRGGESLLSDRRRGVQLSWRERVVERLTTALAPLAVPTSYALVPCSVLQAAPPDDGAA